MSTPPRNRQERIDAARRHSRTALGWIRERSARAGLVRPSSGGLVAGVLAGLARRLGIDPWVVRVAFVVSMLLPGPQFLLYAVLWIVMPRAP